MHKQWGRHDLNQLKPTAKPEMAGCREGISRAAELGVLVLELPTLTVSRNPHVFERGDQAGAEAMNSNIL